MSRRLRYALVGTGARAGMYLEALTAAHADTAQLGALCDLSLRSHTEKADDDRPVPTQGDLCRYRADGTLAQGGLQLPLCPGLHTPPPASERRRRGETAGSRPVVDVGYQPWRRLLPPLAPGKGEQRRPARAQGHAPLRSGQLGDPRGPGGRVFYG